MVYLLSRQGLNLSQSKWNYIHVHCKLIPWENLIISLFLDKHTHFFSQFQGKAGKRRTRPHQSQQDQRRQSPRHCPKTLLVKLWGVVGSLAVETYPPNPSLGLISTQSTEALPLQEFTLSGLIWLHSAWASVQLADILIEADLRHFPFLIFWHRCLCCMGYHLWNSILGFPGFACLRALVCS